MKFTIFRNKKILFIGLTLFLLLYVIKLFMVTENYSQSLEFSDESAHMVAGYFMSKGAVLYKDLSMNHQPLIYIFSAILQEFISVNSLFLFVKRHREFMFLYSVLWNLVFLYSFGSVAVLFILIFEVIKFFMLGNLFLGEAFAVYPFVFMLGIVIQKLFWDKKISVRKMILFSISSFVVGFTLLPLAFSMIIMNLTLLYLHRKDKKLILAQLLPQICLTVLLFLFIPLKEYLLETIIYNYQYLYPVLKRPQTILDWLATIFLPVTALSLQPNVLQTVVLVLTVIYGYNAYLSYKMKKVKEFLLLTFIIILANNRVTRIQEEYYEAFHLLPWMGGLIMLQIYYFLFVQKQKDFIKNKYIRYTPHILLTVLIIWLYTFAKTPFTVKKNIDNENYIGYAYDNTIGLGIKAIKSNGDRAAVFPHDSLINWVSQTEIPTRLIEHYDWSYKIPQNDTQFRSVFKYNPPEFVVINGGINRKIPFQIYLLDILKKNYIEVKHMDKPAGLYILKSKLGKISNEQWNEFNYFQFTRP